jgi:hypothetical protein
MRTIQDIFQGHATYVLLQHPQIRYQSSKISTLLLAPRACSTFSPIIPALTKLSKLEREKKILAFPDEAPPEIGKE